MASFCAFKLRANQAIALISGEQEMTFLTLHEGTVAEGTARGVKPGVVVGVALPRTPSLIVSVLAVQPGAAYLALDPASRWRMHFIVDDSRARFVQRNHRASLRR